MTISADMVEQPSWRFIFRHPAHFLAFGFGAGLSPLAPGTVGTLAAFPLYRLLSHLFGPAALAAALAFLFALGVWACGKAEKALGVSDHGGIVWDEIVAFMLVLYLVPQTPLWFAAAFILFRLFDIWKPFPIRRFDEKIRHGLGIMLDDVLAAAYTVLVVWALRLVL